MSFWRGKRVLVTGHTGFKGAWASLMLSRLGAHVIGLSLAPEQPSLYAQANVAALLAEEHLVDLRDEDATRHAIVEAAPTIVLHFAAQSLVRRAHRMPVATFATNVLGTVHLLEALRHCGNVSAILITTTDKVYLNTEDGTPFREGDRLGGLEPYGASKAAVEAAIAAYRASYFDHARVPVVVARAGNVIGGGDWSEDRIIPDIVRARMSGQELSVRHPHAVRPWQHVLDALSGYLLLIERVAGTSDGVADPEAMAWNFGPEIAAERITVGQICAWAERIWPQALKWRVMPDQSGVKESHLLLLDPAKAIRTLGWRPRLAPLAAMELTLDWYSGFLMGRDPRELTLSQIDAQLSVAA